MEFKHVPSLTSKLQQALCLPEYPEGEGTLIEPVAESRVVRRYTGTPLVVRFDGGCA